MDPLAKAYMTILEESDSSGIVDSSKSQVGKAFGNDESEKKSKDLQPNSATENADSELENPEEADSHLSTHSAEGQAKVMKKESTNPFDVLYNKVLSEEGAFDFSTQDNSLEPSQDFGAESDDMDEFGDEETEEETDQVTISIDKELAEKLMEVLSAVLGDESSEEESDESEMGVDIGGEEGEDEGGEEGEDENPFKESVEAEELGHALVDQEKLEKGMNKKENKVVKGAVPVSNKKAQTPNTGKGSDGQVKSHSCEGGISKLTSKNNNVGGVTVGKSLFDQ